MGDVECFTVSPSVHFWASEMGSVLYMFRLWSSPWPVSKCRLYHSLSTSAITNPQPHIGIVEWGLYWSSLPCSYHQTFMKLTPDIHLMKCLLLISLVKMAAKLPRPQGLLSLSPPVGTRGMFPGFLSIRCMSTITKFTDQLCVCLTGFWAFSRKCMERMAWNLTW